MCQEQSTLSPELLDEVCEQCHKSTPMMTVEAIAVQIQLARDARARIDEEGITDLLRKSKG